ncbi:MAG TPA: hypothetical protein VGC37_18895 [Friedmanniella sp.]
MTRASVRLADLDPVLGPVAARHADGTPARRVALALLVRGLAASPTIPAGRVHLWVTSRLADRPDVVAVLAADRRRELVAAVRKRVRQGSSPSGRAALRTRYARRLAGRVLSPGAAGGGAAEVRARAVVAYVGGITLASLADDGSGIEAPRVDAGRVAVALGCEAQAAKAALRRAVEEGRLTRVGAPRRGVAHTYRLPQLHGAAVAVADDHPALIDALAGAGEHPAAAVLRSVGHAAWGYGGLTHRAWAVAVADAAGVDPADLGVPARAATSLRRELDRAGVPAGGPSFTEALDLLARAAVGDGGWSSPATRQAEAEQRRAVRAAERSAEVARHRSEQAAAREAARAQRSAGRAQDRATQRTAARSGGPVDQHGAARTGARTAVALPGWWTSDGPDLGRLRAELGRVRPDLALMEVRDGRAVLKVAAA